jgi:methionyl-tRNA formyltransferase
MEAGLDTGPVLVERVLPIDGRDTTGSLHDKLAVLGADALLVALEGVESGSLVARPQATEGVTYASKIRKEEALIDWSRPAAEIDAKIRAFNPVPGAETRWRGEQLKIWEAEPVMATPAPPGTVLAATGNSLIVATGDSALRLKRVQLAGRKPLPVSDFLRAHSLAGERLG